MQKSSWSYSSDYTKCSDRLPEVGQHVRVKVDFTSTPIPTTVVLDAVWDGTSFIHNDISIPLTGWDSADAWTPLKQEGEE